MINVGHVVMTLVPFFMFFLGVSLCVFFLDGRDYKFGKL